MPTLTDTAKSLIEQDTYMTADECEAYLKDPMNRNTISRQLANTLKAVGFEGDKDAMIRFLFDKLTTVDKVPQEGIRAYRQMIRRWFYDNVPMRRDMAFKCCFALGLDIKQSADLLRKGCFLNGFNKRDAEEVISYYCLYHGLPYSDAQKMLADFHAVPDDGSRDDIGTKALTEQLEDAVLYTPDAFMKRFMIPNKNNFIGYSKTAAAILERENEKLCFNIILWHLEPLKQTNGVSNDKTAAHDSYWTQDPVLRRVLDYIDSRAEGDDDFHECSALLHSRRSDDAKETADQVIRFVRNKSGDFKRDWRQILTPDRLFDEVVYGIPEYWREVRKVNRGVEQFRPYAERAGFMKSDLYGKNNVMSAFPRAEDLSEMKHARGRQAFAPEARKAFILLKFFNFCYEYMLTNSPNLNYKSFYDDLTNCLEACHLAYLYSGDPFDWLILKSVRLFELSSDEYDYEEDGDPVEYFNEVIRLSFPVPEEEE